MGAVFRVSFVKAVENMGLKVRHPSLASSVTLGKLLNLIKPQFFSIGNR